MNEERGNVNRKVGREVNAKEVTNEVVCFNLLHIDYELPSDRSLAYLPGAFVKMGSPFSSFFPCRTRSYVRFLKIDEENCVP